MKFGIGQSVLRVEDARLVSGEGRYTSDFLPADTVHVVFAVSPWASAAIRSMDLTAARAAAGVIKVYDGAEIQAAGLRDLSPVVRLKNQDDTEMFVTRRPLLARERVRFVGENVAMVVAETPEQARDAADLIEVDYDPSDAVVDLERAIQDDAPKVWPEAGSNVAFDWAMGDAALIEAAFAKAAHITRAQLRQQRVVVNPIEPRAALGEWDSEEERWTLRVGSQGAHGMRGHVAGALGVDADKIRVVSDDVGGSFGMKIFIYPEYPLVLHVAKDLGRPVRWVGTRRESMLSDIQGRGHLTDASLALDDEGRILAIKVDTLGHVGAYISQFSAMILTLACAGMHAGVYQVPALRHRVRGVLTNGAWTDAYRGAGRPEASFVIERLMDIAAGEIGLSRAEIRRRNFVRPEMMGTTKAPTLPFDSGDFDACMTKALEAVDAERFAARREEALSRKARLGLGLACYVERTAAGMSETAKVVVDSASGKVVVYTGSQSSGQGHETAWTQLVCERLGIDKDDVQVMGGDSDAIATGGGTGGSRSLYMVANAMTGALDGVLAKGRRAAAQVLEASDEDIEYQAETGRFVVVGSDRGVSLFEAAAQAAQDEALEPLAEESSRQHNNRTFPNGCHVCEVEIDEETGVAKITRYVIVDDFGKLLNPALVEGQVHGGVAQGLGQAIGETALYDESGQSLNASFMDYFMPRADDVPTMEIAFHQDCPTPTNALGVKGCGEAGTVGAIPAYVSAVADALGKASLDMPLTAQTIWRAMQEAT